MNATVDANRQRRQRWEARKLVCHSLGLGDIYPTRRWSYRNHYCAGIIGGIPPKIYWMLDQGYLVPGDEINNGKSQYFHVTRKAVEDFGYIVYVRNQDYVD